MECNLGKKTTTNEQTKKKTTRAFFHDVDIFKKINELSM